VSCSRTSSAEERAGRAALLLDRDGTLNVDRGWVHRPEDFTWTVGARETIKWANQRDMLVLIVTNQSGIARGYFSEEQFRVFTAWIDAQLASVGARIDATYFCPHHPTEGTGRYAVSCLCRKPAPGLIQQAVSEWQLDRARCLMIGDSETDMQAAAAAGIRGMRFTGGSLLDCVVGTLG
jgi:D-glycero-D-manno-heptose 1,7-bisphosphate phosphatase